MLHGKPIQTHLPACPSIISANRMEYKFVIKAHESSHVPEGISAKKMYFDKK
jgi:hypothetical protein